LQEPRFVKRLHLRRRGIGARVRPLLAWAALALPVGAHAATRYRCVMLDGSQQLAMQDLSRRFAAAVDRCDAVEVSAPDAAPPQFAADGSFPGMRGSGGFSMRPRFVPIPAWAAPPGNLQQLVAAASRRQGLDPALVSALVHVESRYQAGARSPKGAIGLMQIMPATGSRYGVGSARDLFDPATNIEVGTRYLRDLTEMFNGRVDLVLAAYNAGEGAVRRYGNRVPPYPETQDYVRKIIGLQDGR
jgi:hypothetical protein